MRQLHKPAGQEPRFARIDQIDDISVMRGPERRAHLQQTFWDGPRQRVALDWVDVEFANLRAGFRWATDQGDLVAAAAFPAQEALLVDATPTDPSTHRWIQVK